MSDAENSEVESNDAETLHQLHEAVRSREALLMEASGLLAAGAGEDSPEYEEFTRLRKELPEIVRTPDLDHCVRMVRQKTKEFRVWLRRMDRALGTADPVGAIITFMEKLLVELAENGQTEGAATVATLISEIEHGSWVEKVELDNKGIECSDCGTVVDNIQKLHAHCAYSACRMGK